MKNETYDGYSIKDPNGILMSRCTKERAHYYINKGLANWENDKTIVLNFKPKGLGWDQFGDIKDYFLQNFENRCVVCGKTEGCLVKTHIIPLSFRQYFDKGLVKLIRPFLMHDVMRVCMNHRKAYQKIVNDKIKLMVETMNFDKDNITPSGVFYGDRKKLGKLASKASAILKFGDKIPKERRDEFYKGFKECLGKEVITEKDLYYIIYKSKGRKPDLTFGEFVVRLTLHNVINYEIFLMDWRYAFLKMEPKFLPKGWNPEFAMIKYACENRDKLSTSDSEIIHLFMTEDSN